MFVKLAVVACSLAFASAVYNGPLAGGQPASLYPAGVDPASCPNYPDCSNPAVAVNQVPQSLTAGPQYPQFQPSPQYQSAPQYQPASQYQPAAQYQPAPQYQPASQYQSAPQYQPQQPQQQYSPDVQRALDRGEYIGDGDYRGEGLAESLAPGYSGQSYASPSYNTAQQYSAPAYNPTPVSQYAGQQQPAQIPAGLDPQACPNYPFCH